MELYACDADNRWTNNGHDIIEISLTDSFVSCIDLICLLVDLIMPKKTQTHQPWHHF